MGAEVELNNRRPPQPPTPGDSIAPRKQFGLIRPQVSADPAAPSGNPTIPDGKPKEVPGKRKRASQALTPKSLLAEGSTSSRTLL